MVQGKAALAELPIDRGEVEVRQDAGPPLLEYFVEQARGIDEVAPEEQADGQHQCRVQVSDLQPLVLRIDFQGPCEPPDRLVRAVRFQARQPQQAVGG